MTEFRAILLTESDGRTSAVLDRLPAGALPEGDVTVRVTYSDLNYKDGLAVTGTGRIVRSFPMVPGIDLAGTVESSHSPRVRPGDRVFATGWGLGETHWGGYAELWRGPGEWLQPLPEGLDLQHAMAIGTAGFTAMLCVMALEDRGLTNGATVLVTGASGGVGSLAVSLLSRLGYRVAASTGRSGSEQYLRTLGAVEIIPRQELSAPSRRPLDSQRWDAAVDTVGGNTLAGVLRSLRYHGAVAAVGNAGGADLNTTVYPFILRAVALLGVETVVTPMARRVEAWNRLARELPREKLERMMTVAPLDRVPELARRIVEGGIRGRTVIAVSD